MGLMRIYPKAKKRKAKKPTAAERKLADDWAATLARHSGPLEAGAKVRGRLPDAKQAKGKIVLPTAVSPYKRQNPDIPSLPMQGTATKPATDELAQAKKELSGRVGQAYPKGGAQYLTDADLKEQLTGAHKRRT